MRSVDEQVAKVLATAVRPAPVRVAISEARGLLCAEQVIAERGLPDFDQAAVDGYAVRSVDVRPCEAEAVTLPVVGEIPAGSRQPRRLQPGQAVRVVTGAPLPTLADAVVPAEATDGQHAKVTVYAPVPSAGYVRRAGEDVQTGDVAVRRGSIIGPAQVGMLAAVGRGEVLVHPRPRVAVISVGDELVDLDRTPGAGQVYDVNSYALAAAARDAGAEVTRTGKVPGDAKALRDAVEARLPECEAVVIAGPAAGSGGEGVAAALDELGSLELTRVAMHPGSVQGFGRLGPGAVPTFLLPVNPVSALLVFEVMVRPLIRTALGKHTPYRRLITARLLSPVTSTPGRKGFLRGALLREEGSGAYLVSPLRLSGAHLLASLAEANALIVLDEETTSLAAGEDVTVSFLARRS
jgi:molybdopterin molybdotransferase